MLIDNEIYSMSNREELSTLKDKIKDLIVDNSISWQQRIHLYRQVKLINDRLKDL